MRKLLLGRTGSKVGCVASCFGQRIYCFMVLCIHNDRFWQGGWGGLQKMDTHRVNKYLYIGDSVSSESREYTYLALRRYTLQLEIDFGQFHQR